MEERYHYDSGNVTLCKRPLCSLEHYSIGEASVLLRDDTLGDRYAYRPRHRKRGEQ